MSTEQIEEAMDNGQTLRGIEDDLDHAENNPVTGDVNLNGYPEEEPKVDPFAGLSDAISRLAAGSDDWTAKNHAAKMLDLASKGDAALVETVATMRRTIELLEGRLDQMIMTNKQLLEKASK